VTTSRPSTEPTDEDEDAAEEVRLGPSGFRSLERWEVVAYLFWVLTSLAIVTAWIWWQRAKEAGVF
jgi:hypothetical protein